MKVLLLGANGLLGHNVLRQLLLQGHSVRAIVRRQGAICPRCLPDVYDGEFDITVGSILHYPTLVAAATGCDAVVNCAGVTDMSLLRLDDYIPINARLCQLLVSLIDELGIATLVHVSTANTIGYGSPSSLSAESEPPQPPFCDSFYAKSKIKGEEALLQAVSRYSAQQLDKHIIILNPGFMIGAYDTKPSSGRLLLAAYRRPVMLVPKGGKSFIHVAAAAAAVVSALANGTTGQRYLLTGQNLSLSQLYRLQATLCGYRQQQIAVPNWLLLALGYCGDLLRKLHIATQLSSVNVRQLMAREYYCNASAKQHLGLQDIPIAEAIKDFYADRT